MDSEPAALVFAEILLHIGGFHPLRIEGFPVMGDDHLEACAVRGHLHIDVPVSGILIRVLDDVGACLIDREHDFPRRFVVEARFPRRFRDELADEVELLCLALYM